MVRSRFVSLFLVVVYMVTIFGVHTAYGEENDSFEPLYESFNYPDGTTTIPGWNISNNRGAAGDIKEVQDGRLRILTGAEIGTTVIEKKLPVPFSGNKAIFQFTVEVVKNTSFNNMFPGLGSNGGPGTTQIQMNENGALTSARSNGANISLDMKIEEGFTYDFGLIIDLENQTQEIYVKNTDTGEIDNITSGLQTDNFDSIEYIKFWMDKWNGGPTGEYYFDNFRLEEASGDPLLAFYEKFIPGDEDDDDGDISDDEDIKIDHFNDIKAKIGNGVVISEGSTYAFAKGSRIQIEENDDEIVPIMESEELLVPGNFIANSLEANYEWDQENDTVTISKESTVVNFTVSESVYTVNDTVYHLQVSPRIEFDTPYIPISALAGSLGKKIYSNGKGLYEISDEENLLDAAEDQVMIDKLIHTFGIYVSPNGNDGSAGTAYAPFQTLEKARDFLRTMKEGDGLPEGGMTVYIAGGEYRFYNSLTLEKEDSGTSQSPITYKAIHGEEVRFTGAFNIPTDEFVSVTDPNILDRLYENVRDKVVQVDLGNLGLHDYGSVRKANVFLREEPDTVGLILDNIPQTLARWPNEGYVKTGDISKGDNTTTVGYLENTPERWSQAEEPWALGFWQYEWRDGTLPIQGIDTNNKNLIMENTGDGYKKGQHYYVFNLLEEIDQPGEWYLNRDTGILYYYPPKELDDNKLQLSLLDEPMIVMTNTANIHIKGITFEASTTTGVIMNYAKNNQVSNNVFRNLGTQAVNIKNASNTGVFDNDIYDIGRGAIYLKGGDRPTLTYGNNYVDNNYITRFSRSVKTYTPAVLLDGVGNRITHNVIHDGPHEGIGVNGNDQLIEYNELYDLCKETGDSGSIYGGRDWTQQGITVRNNILHGMHGNEEMGLHDVFGVYFDDALSGGIIESNVFFDIDTPVNIHGGRSFTIDSNIVANAGRSMRLVNYAISQTTELEARYAAMPVKSDLWKNKYPHIDTILEDDPRLPKYNVVTNTLNYLSGEMEIQPDVYTYGTIEDNVDIDQDPGFADAENSIFKLEEDFNGDQLGLNNFVPIDYDQVGMYVTAHRKSMPRLSRFDLASPMDGEQNVEGAGVTLTWISSLGATKYQVTIATDENFDNIVFDETSKTNSIFVSGLEYNTTTYYWKVNAISGSILYPDTQSNNGGAYSFTTAERQVVDYSELTEAIAAATTFSEETVEGTEPGQYPTEEKANLLQEIEEANTILHDSTVTQEAVENAIATLNDAVAALRGSVITEMVDLGILINDRDNWIAGEDSFLTFQGNTLTFTPAEGKLMVAAYNKILPKYKTWKLKSSFDFGSGDKWQGFGLRASDPQKVGWSAYGSYIVIIKQNQIELQNFHDGSNRFVIPAIPNNGIIEAGKEYDMEIGAVDVKDGVRLILKVDGETVFDTVDAGEGNNRFIDDPGYLVIYSSQGYSFHLAAAGEIVAPEEPVITSIDSVSVSTTRGVAPMLPTTVTVTYDDDTTKELEVQWDNIDSQDYEQRGSFTVEGIVAGTELKAVAIITVIDTPLYEPVYEDFDYPDGTTELPYWNFSNNKPSPGDVVEVVNGQLKIITSAPEGTVVMQRRLYEYPEKFSGKKAVFQYTAKVVKLTGFENMFPGLGANNSAGTTQIQVSSNGTVTSVVPSTQGGNKSFDMHIEEGKTYDFGFVIDLENQVQDIYMKDISTGEIDKITTGLKNADWNSIEYIKFWLGGTAYGVGEFYFDNLRFEEATTEAMEEFEGKFANPEEPQEPVITSIDPVNVTTRAGVAPILPTNVTVVYDDDASEEVAVQWDTVDSQDYEQPGRFTVEGVVAGTTVKAVATITVVDHTKAVLTGANYVNNGEEFTVTYGVLNAKDITAQDITISYDPALFQYVDTVPLQEGMDIIEGIEVDTETGTIQIIVVSLGNGNVVNDSEDILGITFKAIGSGTGTINVTQASFGTSQGDVVYPEKAGITIGTGSDKEALNAAIDHAQEFYDNAQEGLEIGMYHAGTKDRILKSAIEAATAVRDNAGATNEDVTEAVEMLNTQVSRFQQLIITENTGDVNTISGIDIGDLGIVAGAYGMEEGQQGWDGVKSLDLNDDGVIELYDLAFIAKKYLLK